MRKKIICVFVALALVSLALALIPAVFSQPENIKVLNYTYYVDNQGILDVVGQVQNVGPNTVDPVYLTGSISSSSGEVLSQSFCKVWVAYLTPQQKAPFYMEFYPPQTTNVWEPSDISKITLKPSIANATSSYQYPDLKITSSSASIGSTGDYNGAYLVNGIIQNTGSQTATNITVVGTFYNATGSVVAVGYTNYLTPATVAPSGTVSFQVGAFDLNQTQVSSGEKISSYSLLVQAQGPILQGTAPIVTPYQGSGSSPSTSTTSSPSSSSSPTDVNSNNASNPAVIYAIVIVVVLIAVAGTIVALRKSKPHETVKAAKKARKKRMVEILPRAFFSKLQGTTSRRNVPLFKYFLRTQVCL
jgi:flagellar basal body-associated protein FliL